MKSLLFLLLLTATLCPCSAQQETSLMTTDLGEMKRLPQWLVEFSNLPRDTRTRYIDTFNRAKLAYRERRWIDCISLLVDCEIIQRGNPGVWNLRACCLMEQKFFAEATDELERVLKAEPDNHVALMNLANMHMACGRYGKSIEMMEELRETLPYGTSQEIYNILDFRTLLCHLMQGNEPEARQLVAHLTPMSDTPLYYYSRAAFALARRDIKEAEHCLNVASRIFARNQAYEPYNRSLELSGIKGGVK